MFLCSVQFCRGKISPHVVHLFTLVAVVHWEVLGSGSEWKAWTSEGCSQVTLGELSGLVTVLVKLMVVFLVEGAGVVLVVEGASAARFPPGRVVLTWGL